MFSIAKPVAVDVHKGRAFLAVPAFHLRAQSVSATQIGDIKFGIGVTGKAQACLNNRQAHEQAADKQQKLDPPFATLSFPDRVLWIHTQTTFGRGVIV